MTTDDRTSAGLRITALVDQPGLAVEGDVDFRSLGEFTDALAQAIEQHPADVYVDLGGITFMEVSAMRVLADTQRQLAAMNRKLVLRNLAPHLQPVLRVVGWYDSADSAD